jgi:hypothetical protein
MKKNSSSVNILVIINVLICMFVLCNFTGCYSFTGGTVPEHLKTLQVDNVNDVSGYGVPRYREELTLSLVNRFEKDNTFSLAQRNGNARLTVSILSITDATLTVRPGEVESQRRISVNCEAEYYDAVKQKSIWKQNFTNAEIYDVSNLQEGRNSAVKIALERLTDDIFLAVISGW